MVFELFCLNPLEENPKNFIYWTGTPWNPRGLIVGFHVGTSQCAQPRLVSSLGTQVPEKEAIFVSSGLGVFSNPCSLYIQPR